MLCQCYIFIVLRSSFYSACLFFLQQDLGHYVSMITLYGTIHVKMTEKKPLQTGSGLIVSMQEFQEKQVDQKFLYFVRVVPSAG